MSRTLSPLAEYFLELRERMLALKSPVAAIMELRSGFVSPALFMRDKHTTVFNTPGLPDNKFGLTFTTGGTEYRLTIESSAVKPL